ncbi:MAG TPA: type II secretion system protein [Tepidisphaeraceae bacterium]|jgi:general secretion pathway protein G|nr:type II secretion system protein [Tepidisphaeraceae bacterium]
MLTRPHCGRAFTLVELLVVIGIIAVLISILLPSLGKAREAGNTVACLSNQRQIALAIQMYVADQRGWMPKTEFIDLELTSYFLSRGDGSNGTKIWTCPNRNENLTFVTQKNPITFAFNNNAMPWLNFPGEGRKMSQIRHPSRALLLGDGRENFSWGSWVNTDNFGASFQYKDDNDINSFNDRTWFEANGHKLSDPVYVVAADKDGPEYAGPSGLRYRHNRNTAVAAAFVDGHVESFRKGGLTKANFITKW